jgi:hypothetical protein
VKSVLLILWLPLFALSTLVMPYGNYDDVVSLQAVFNQCYKSDADMDLLEFVGDKLLVAGFEMEDSEERPADQAQAPFTNAHAVVQIQSIVWFPTTQQALLPIPTVLRCSVPPALTSAIPQPMYHPGIFHPPAC